MIFYVSTKGIVTSSRFLNVRWAKRVIWHYLVGASTKKNLWFGKFQQKTESHPYTVALRMTPAMAAGLMSSPWEIGDLVALVEAAQPGTKNRGPYKKRI